MGQEQQHYVYSAHSLCHCLEGSEMLSCVYYNYLILKKKGPQPVKHKAPFLPYCEEKKQLENNTRRT